MKYMGEKATHSTDAKATPIAGCTKKQKDYTEQGNHFPFVAAQLHALM